VPGTFSTHISPPYNDSLSPSMAHPLDILDTYLDSVNPSMKTPSNPLQSQKQLLTPAFDATRNNPAHRRHSISHIPMQKDLIPGEELKVTKWTNVTASVTKKYSKQDLLNQSDQSAQNDVKLMMGKWKCTKYHVN